MYSPLFCSEGAQNPRKEILHNIDPIEGNAGKSLYPDLYDIRVRSALRVGDWKLITGNPSKRYKNKFITEINQITSRIENVF